MTSPVDSKLKGARPGQGVSTRWTHARPDAPLLSLLPHNSFAAEQYRSLATQVEESLAAKKVDSPVLLVTSADPGSGKTLTSLNLAIALARRGERNVLLIEGDLLKPSFSSHLQRDEGLPGLSDVLISNTPPRSAIVTVWNASVDIIFAGDRQEVSDLVTAGRIRQLLEQLRHHYDCILIDSPPIVLAVGRALAAAADAVVVTVRAEQTIGKRVEEALSILGPEKVLGIVLNDVSTKALRYGAYGYGAYGTYGAYQAYAAYEEQAEETAPSTDTGYAESSDPGEADGSSLRATRIRRLKRLLRRAAIVAGSAALTLALGFWLGKGGQERPEGQSPPAEQAPDAAAAAAAVDPSQDPAARPSSGSAVAPEEAAAADLATRTTHITITRLNLRQGPGMDQTILTSLAPGLEVTVREQAGDWFRVTTAEGNGWVHGSGLASPDELAEEEAQATHRTRTQLNLRQQPSLDASVLASLASDLPVVVNESSGDWSRVATPLGEGWVYRSFLAPIGPAVTTSGNVS